MPWITGVGVAYYLEELTRRDVAKATETMVNHTWAIALMTTIITTAMIVNVIAVIL